MSNWGGNDTDETKTAPKWGWLSKLRYPKTLRVSSEPNGWAIAWPWGKEVLVGINNLEAKAGLTVVRVEPIGAVVAAADQTPAVRVYCSRGLAIANPTTLTLTAIASVSSNTANVELAYSASLSTPDEGILVFATANTDLSDAVAEGTLTVNATSVFTANTDITGRKFGDALQGNIPAGLSAVITIG